MKRWGLVLRVVKVPFSKVSVFFPVHTSPDQTILLQNRVGRSFFIVQPLLKILDRFAISAYKLARVEKQSQTEFVWPVLFFLHVHVIIQWKHLTTRDRCEIWARMTSIIWPKTHIWRINNKSKACQLTRYIRECRQGWQNNTIFRVLLLSIKLVQE